MRISILILLSLLMPYAALWGQAGFYPVDSLEAIVMNPPDDSSELSALYWLFNELEDLEPERAKKLLRTQIDRSSKGGHNYWEAMGLRRLAILQIHVGHYDSTMASIERSVALLEESDDPRAEEAKIGSIINHAVYYQVAGELETAIVRYEDARKLAVAMGHDEYLGKILNNLGIAFKRLDRFEPAYRTYQEALALKRRTNDSLGMANTLYNLATLEMKNNGAEPALKLFEESRAIHLARRDTVSAANVDIGIASAYYEIDSMDLAMQIWTKAYETPGLRPNRLEAISMYMGLGDLHNKAGNYERALEFLLSAEELVNPGIDAYMRTDLKGAIGIAYSQLGKASEANEAYRAFQLGMDTLTELKRIEYGQEMSEKYEAELRNAEIERQGLLIERQRWRSILFGVGTFLFALIAGAVFLLYRSRLRYQRSEAAAALLEQRQKITEMEQRAELNNLRSMIEGQEAERHRVAKDLHDGLGGMLSSIKTRISLGNEPLNNAEKMLDVACKEVRRIAHNMVPQSLALSGLTGSLEDICAQMQLEGLDCELEVTGQPELRLGEQEQSMLLRIVQELTHNIHKHAGAERIFIQLLDQPHQILLTVEDDGKGFDPEAVKAGGGLGLSSIGSRVNFLKGDILYDSSPGHGTTVSITIPL
ncbi:hypothetical protein CEQ90_00550 [Lewinellaceae bacterium SD302]|nr:hypothetical protein CEQ90_00550 [Lewinellaceae bacterium SD302]